MKKLVSLLMMLALALAFQSSASAYSFYPGYDAASFNFEALRTDDYLWKEMGPAAGAEPALAKGDKYLIREVCYSDRSGSYYGIAVPQFMAAYYYTGEIHTDTVYEVMPMFRMMLMYYENDPFTVDTCTIELRGKRYLFPDIVMIPERLSSGKLIGGGVGIALTNSTLSFWLDWENARKQGDYDLKILLQGEGRSFEYPLGRAQQDFVLDTFRVYAQSGALQTYFLDEAVMIMPTPMQVETIRSSR